MESLMAKKKSKEEDGMLDSVITIIMGKKKKSKKKKKGEKSIADKIGFAKGGMVKGFKPCKGCPTPANCSAVKGCQNKGK